MVGAEFLEYVKKLHIPDYVGVEDFSDRLSFLYSVLMLIMCGTVVTTKQNMMSAIACYIPTVPSGSDFDKFVENFCWVHGTIPILPGEKIPQRTNEWAKLDVTNRINYYQWVPFMMGLQCTLFYIPRLCWQVICCQFAGLDIEHLVSVAHQAGFASATDREKLLRHVAGSIRALILQFKPDQRKMKDQMLKHIVQHYGILVANKRLGTWLTFSYFIIKFFYMANAIGQLYLMQRFLGFDEGLFSFWTQMTRNITGGHNWEQTRLFPRVSFCYIDDLRQLGSSNKYVAQCVLPMNMLNEKLYIFLWYWTAMVCVFTAISIPVWLSRISMRSNRKAFVEKYLWINELIDKRHTPVVEEFTEDYLCHDGVFLLRIISINAGDVVASELISELWQQYCEHQPKQPELVSNYNEGEGTLSNSHPIDGEIVKSPVSRSSIDSIKVPPTSVDKRKSVVPE